jgi:hypothetical protein
MDFAVSGLFQPISSLHFHVARAMMLGSVQFVSGVQEKMPV